MPPLNRRRFLQHSMSLAAAAAAGCGRSIVGGPDGNTLRLAYSSDYRSMDPAILNDAYATTIARMIHLPLLDYDDDGVKLIPRLAEALPEISDKKCTYTYRIRPDARFANGRAVTASDFIATWERVLKKETVSPNSDYLSGVAGAKQYTDGDAAHIAGLDAPDDRTFVVHLKEPDHNFGYVTAMLLTAPLSADEIEHHDREYLNTHTVGTGPYQIASWQRGMRLDLERNPHYFGPVDGFDRISILLNYDDATQMMMFERAELDAIEVMPPADFVRLYHDPHWRPQMTELTENTTYFLTLNCEMEPFQNPLVRRAFNHAIDRKRVIQMLNNRGTVARGPIPPLMPGYNPDLKGFDYDPARARQLLAEAGYDKQFDLVLWYPSGGERAKIVETVQQNLKDVGVKVRLNGVTYEVFNPAAAKRRNVAFSMSGWFQDYPDPSTFIDMLYNGNNIKEDENTNISFLNNQEINDLIDDAKKEDSDRRYELFRKAEQRIVDECPNVFLYHPERYYMHQPWIFGARMDPMWLMRYDRCTLELR